MRSLINPHGGLEVPVNRILPLVRRPSVLADLGRMPTIVVRRPDLATVQRIADGTLSPLTGPMNEDQFYRVLKERTIVSRGRRYAWTIPLSLPVTDDEARMLEPGCRAALIDEEATPIGILELESVFPWDKQAYVESVYGTTRLDHPGGAIVTSDERTLLVGGDLWAFPSSQRKPYDDQIRSPLEVRALIAHRGYDQALAFQTRNPLHRAHEYALVHGAEELTRTGRYTGVFLHPLVGELKGDDVDAPTRMRCYNVLRDARLLGSGDADEGLWRNVGYDLNDVFHVVGLDMKMFYAGPAEAVMHAIYRQNHGMTHIIIGRKHADAPFADGTAIWGDFDAHEIFDELPAELAITPVKVGFAAYYQSIERVDLMDRHPDERPVFISGSKVREQLQTGTRPDPRIMRPETADVLIQAYAGSSI